MSSSPAIKVQNLRKAYQIYDKPADRLMQFVLPKLQSTLGWPSPKKYFREFLALTDISFEVGQGETVGIIGRNGSGKSTLLQIICGTVNPSSGSVVTNGRIAALLELSSGFNPEFTGLENVYLNASVLGLDNAEIERRLDSILSFADIGDFVNQPVKTYSSGMVVRLGFAVAINVDPQILVVDEALSVGDELFQRKCFSRIAQIKESGATILFVSHSGSTVVELCDRAILLDEGELLCTGTPKATIGKYQKLIYAPLEMRDQIRQRIKAANDFSSEIDSNSEVNSVSQPPNFAVAEEMFDPHLVAQSTLSYEPQGAHIESAKIQTLDGREVNCLRRGELYRYTYKVKFVEGATNIRFGMLIKTTTGLELGGAVTAPAGEEGISHVPPGCLVDVEFKFRCSVNPGTYFLNAGVIGITQDVDTFLHRVLDILTFKVLPESKDSATALIDFECKPTVTLSHTID